MSDAGVPLPGGVASDIRIVSTPDGEVVVKTALAKLKVAADWFSDPARSATEVAALKVMAELMGPFPGHAANREAMLRVIRNHRRATLGEGANYERLAIHPVALDA